MANNPYMQQNPWSALAAQTENLVSQLPRFSAQAAQAAQSRADAEIKQQKLQSAAGIPGLITRAIASPQDFQSEYPYLVQNYVQGGGDMKDMGDLFRAAINMVPGATDQQRMSGALAAGQNLNENASFSPAGQDRIAARNNRLQQQREIAVVGAKPIEVGAGSTAFLPPGHPLNSGANGGVLRGMATESTAKGAALSRAPENLQQAAAMSGVTPRNYRTSEGKGGITLDGVTDASDGSMIPQGANIYSTQAQPQNDLFGKNMVGNLAEQQGEITATADIIRNMKDLGKDPTNFGAAALVKGAVGDFGAQAQALTQLTSRGLGAELAGQMNADVQGAIQRAGIQKDPALAKLEVYRAILPYKLASVLAGQSGRSVSDKDVAGMKNAFEEAGLFGNAQDFETKLPVLLSQLGLRQDINNQLLGGKIPQANIDGIPQMNAAELTAPQGKGPIPFPPGAGSSPGIQLPGPSSETVQPDLIWDVQKGGWVTPGGK